MAFDPSNPIDNPEAEARVLIGQGVSPGICEVNGFERKHEWDIKKGKGAVGATITYVGRPPAQGSITFYLWTASQFDDWADFAQLFKYDPTKKEISAVDIYHPALASIGVKSVVVESISPRKHEGKGLYSIKVDLLEYLPPPPKSAVSTPQGSKPGSTSTNGGKPVGKTGDPIADAQQAEIKKLLDEAGKP